MDMQTLTQMTLAFELAEQVLCHTKIAAYLGRHRETIGLWLKGICTCGFSGFLERHTPAKTGPRRACQVPRDHQAADWGAAGPRAQLLRAEDRVFPGAGVSCPALSPEDL